MFIKTLKVKNFRGIDISLNNLSKNFLIIGKNDSGKSNLCYALRKILDFDIRKIPFDESDSSDNNQKDITIEIEFDLSDISGANRSRLGKVIEENEEGKEILVVKYKGVFNPQTLYYDEELSFGNLDPSKDYGTNRSNLLDEVLQVIYINPNYNIEKIKKDFFRYQYKKSLEEKTKIDENIKKSIEELNKNIKKEPSLQEINHELNQQKGFDSIFDNVNFELSSDIDITNIYKTLNIIPFINNQNEIKNIGDGKSKTLSMLLQKLMLNSDKEKIMIIEEPENHLYPLLQKYYADLTSKMEFNQIIYTSHSPYIIDFKKVNQILKLAVVYSPEGYRITKKYSLNIQENSFSRFGYLLNEEIAEMFFYDKVLLIEGLSEKYFYNTLFRNDEKFHKFIVDNRFGIFNVMGVDFWPSKEILKILGIQVLIKTDNDIYGIPHHKDEKQFAGLERTFNCLDVESQNNILKLLEISQKDKNTFRFNSKTELQKKEKIENLFPQIQKIYEKNGVYISSDNEGFEGDFLRFINNEELFSYSEEIAKDFKFLKESKLKNLHTYCQEKNIIFNLNKNNKDSILVRFMNNEYK